MLIALYSRLKAAGLLEAPWGRALLLWSYFQYKRWIEDPFHHLVETRPDLFTGGHVLDIGANLGYTATLFARAIQPAYQVFSFEPGSSNCELMRLVLARRGLEGRVSLTRAAVGRQPGRVRLFINRDHHADHRVLTDALQRRVAGDAPSEEVLMVSVDQFVEVHGVGPICFVKIDVQGYEAEVCAGMANTLERNPGACVAFEHSPGQSAELGLDPEEPLRSFLDRGYQFSLLERGRALRPLTVAERQVRIKRRGYIDILASRRSLV